MKYRQSKKYFLLEFTSLLVASIWSYPFFKVLLLIFKNFKLALGILIIGYILSIFRIILGYFTTYFVVKDNNLYIHYGTIIIRTLHISTDNVSLIISNTRIENNFYHKLFNTKGLTIFFSGSEEEENEITFSAISPRVLNILLAFLSQNSIKKDQLYAQKSQIRDLTEKISFSTIFKTSILSSNYILIYLFLSNLLEFLNIHKSAKDYISNSLVVNLVSIVILMTLSILVQYFKYGNFTLKENDNEFIIKNGFIIRDINKIHKDNIKGIEIKSSLNMRFFKTINISAILSNENQGKSYSQNFLFPLTSLKNKNFIIQKHFPEISEDLLKNKNSIGIFRVILFLFSIIVLYMVLHTFNISWQLSLIVIYLSERHVSNILFTKVMIHGDFCKITKGFLNKKEYLLPINLIASKSQKIIGKIVVKSLTFNIQKGIKTTFINLEK